MVIDQNQEVLYLWSDNIFFMSFEF